MSQPKPESMFRQCSFFFLAFLSFLNVAAQSAKLSVSPIILQERASYQSINLQNGALHTDMRFVPTIDIAAGSGVTYEITPKLKLTPSIMINYSKYARQGDQEDNTFFIDYFKGIGVAYFRIDELRFTSLELPIDLSYQFFAKDKIALSGVAGVTFQKVMSANVSGKSFESNEVRSYSVFTNQNQTGFPSMDVRRINDVFVSVGVNFEFVVKEIHAVVLQPSFEISPQTKFSGSKIKLGYRL